MTRAPRISRARAVALTRPLPVVVSSNEWLVAAVAVALLLVGLLGL